MADSKGSAPAASSSSAAAAAAPVSLGGGGDKKNQGDRLDVNAEKQKDVRTSNFVAAKAVADTVRTSLGPKGMDKMISSSSGDVIITNDGATIMQKMEVLHPAARMLVDISKAQDVEAGDGTTTVVVLAGGLLDAAQQLLVKGVHATQISDAFMLGAQKAVEIARSIAKPVDLTDKTQIIQSAITSLNSKVVSENSELLAPIAVDSVLRLVDEKNIATLKSVDLRDIKIHKKMGGTIEDTELVDGLVFDQAASHAASGPTRVDDAKIGLIQFCISPPKSDIESQVLVADYQEMDRVLKEERAYILGMIKKIVKSGCNVLLIQKSILRDAVNDLALHYLAKQKIMVIRDIERNEIEFISKTLGCIPVANIDSFTAERLGRAKLVEEISTPGGKIVKVTGVQNPGRTVTILCRGSNRLVIDEAERSIHDALCVVRSLVKEQFLVPGGSAPEAEICVQLTKLADTIGGIKGYCIRKFAEAFEVIPYTLSENAGLKPINIVSELKRDHALGLKQNGINVKKGTVSDMVEENVIQPLLVTTSAIKLATEFVRMMLKIDDIVAVR